MPETRQPIKSVWKTDHGQTLWRAGSATLYSFLLWALVVSPYLLSSPIEDAGDLALRVIGIVVGVAAAGYAVTRWGIVWASRGAALFPCQLTDDRLSSHSVGKAAGLLLAGSSPVGS